MATACKFSQAVQAVDQALTDTFDTVDGLISDVENGITGALDSLQSTITGQLSSLGDTIASNVPEIPKPIKTLAGDIGDMIGLLSNPIALAGKIVETQNIFPDADIPAELAKAGIPADLAGKFVAAALTGDAAAVSRTGAVLLRSCDITKLSSFDACHQVSNKGQYADGAVQSAAIPSRVATDVPQALGDFPSPKDVGSINPVGQPDQTDNFEIVA